MKYLKSYQLFEELMMDLEQNKPKSPKYKEMPTLYQDNNLMVKVVKTFAAAEDQGKNTNWCSNSPEGFHSHNLTANMYRFNFKDGYKLRLTWDYITQNASELGHFYGGTHWGQGGLVDGVYMPYTIIRPMDDNHPFDFDYKKDDARLELVKRIQSIPEKAQLAVYDYQEKHSKEKTHQLNTLYKEIEKIKVISAKKLPADAFYDLQIEIVVEYKGKKYTIEEVFYGQEKVNYRFNLNELESNFKKKYLIAGQVLSRYLHDKTMACIKKGNDTELIDDIKYLKEDEK